MPSLHLLFTFSLFLSFGIWFFWLLATTHPSCPQLTTHVCVCVFSFLTMAKCPLPTYTEAKIKCVSLETWEVCPSLSTYVIPAGFAFRFVASSLLNKLFPQTFNIVLEHLMSCGKKEEKHPFFPPSSTSMWGSTLVMSRRITLICLLCLKDMFFGQSNLSQTCFFFSWCQNEAIVHAGSVTPASSGWWNYQNKSEEWNHRCCPTAS